MALSEGGRRPVAVQAFWAVLSWFAGLAVARAETAPTHWITERALWCLAGFVGLGLLILFAGALRRRSFRWRPRKRDGEGEFARQTYWAVFSLLLGVASPVLVNGKTADVAGIVAAVLFGLAAIGTGIVSLRRRRTEPTWPPKRNPYPLLVPYTANYASVYFGRADEVAAIAHRAREGETVTERFIAVVGPSGCGKSSLVQGGVLPALERRDLWPPSMWFRPKALPPLHVGSDPYTSLAAALGGSKHLAEAMRRDASAASASASNEDERPAGSAELARAVARCRGFASRLVLVLDQMEELSGAPEQRLPFLLLLKCALRDDRRLVILTTVRPDLFGPLLEGPAADLFSEQVVVVPMTRRRLASVIEGPARAARVELGDGVVHRMLEDTAGADALPVLSYLLHYLWEHAADDGLITLEEYEREMGDHNVIASHAEAAADALAPAVSRVEVLDSLLQLVNYTGTEAYRRRIRLADLGDRQRVIIDHFGAPGVRLVSLGAEGDDRIAEIAHEAVLRQWPALAEHIEVNREALRLRTRLEPVATSWNAASRDADRLLRGAELREAERWPLLEQGLVGEFVAASLVADDAEAERRADLAAERAVLAVDPPPVVRDVDLAMAIAAAAVSELRPTLPAAFALYRVWSEGNRGVLRGHSDSVRAVAWSPDGTRLATGAHDFTARIWTGDGTALRELTGHTGTVGAVAWSPDGTRLATAADNTPRIWAGDGTGLYELTGHTGVVVAVVWSPDGTCLATASIDRTARIWTGDGTALHELTGHTGAVMAVAWSPDGTRLATAADDGAARIWTADGTLMHELTHPIGHNAETAVAWSPDGTRLATAAADNTARIWTADGTLMHELTGHTSPVTAVAWSPDGTRLATATDGTARIWTADGTLMHELTGHTSPVMAVAWSPDGTRLATAAAPGTRPITGAAFDDRTARIWTADGTLMHELTGHTNLLTAVAWSPDGTRLATAAADSTARLWTAGGSLRQLTGHTTTVGAVAWSPDGARLATAAADKTARIWTADGTAVHELTGHTRGVWAVAWSPDGTRLATASSDRTARIWSADGIALHELIHLSGLNAMLAVAWSPDGTRLATAVASDSMARIWTVDGTLMHELTGHTSPVWAVAWSPDGSRLATASSDRTARIWSADGTALHELTGHADTANAVAWSPDGTRLATASLDRTARIWSADGTALHELTGHAGTVVAVAWSPDGTRLATIASHDHTARIWTANGIALHELTGHTDWVTAVAWSPDGARLASTSRDRTVRIWAADGTALHELIGHTEWVMDVAWSPDGTCLATASYDGTARLWPNPPSAGDLAALVAALPGLPVLTVEQRRRASLPVPAGS